MNKMSLMRRFNNMDMKSAIKLTLLELLEDNKCLILDKKTWNLLFKLGKSFLGLSSGTVRISVKSALIELQEEGKIQIEEAPNQEGIYLIYKIKENGEE